MVSSTETLIQALEVLSWDIETDDGVVNAVLSEAALRLKELDDELKLLKGDSDV